MLSNHLNLAVNGEVYCHRLMKVVQLTNEHFNTNCAQCPHFQGSYQGQGVECKYEDPLAAYELTQVTDPYYQAERMRPTLAKSARRGGMWNLNDEERRLFGVQPLPQEVLDDEAAERAELEKLRLEQMLKRQDEALLKKLREIQFDPDSPVMELDVEQHMNADDLVRRWVVDHPYFHGTIVTRVGDVENNNPTLEERGYYVRFSNVNRFNEFGAVAGPQRQDVLRRIGFFNDVPPQAPKLNMMFSMGALARVKRDGRVGQVVSFVEERGTLKVMLKFMNITQAFTMDEVEPLMRKAAGQDRDAKGRFAFMAINSPQPPSKDGEHEAPEYISATEALHRVLQSKNHQKHLSAREPDDREAWIARYKKLWVGNRPYRLQEIPLSKLDARKVDFNEETVQKYVENFPDDKFPIVAPDKSDHPASFAILDGNHTVEAARRLGKETIRAYVREDAKLMKAAGQWEEQKHPRDHGKFASKPGAQGEQKDEKKAKPLPKQEGSKEGTGNRKEIPYQPNPNYHDPVDPSKLPLTDKEKKDVAKLKGDPVKMRDRLEALRDKYEAIASPTAKARNIQEYANARSKDQKKAYADPAHTYPDSDAFATQKMVKVEDLVAGASRFSFMRDWYEEFQTDVHRMFGEDADLFKTLLSATSPNAQVLANVTLAFKAYKQLKLGEPFEGYLQSVIKQLEHVRRGEPLSGVKIQAFEANNKGDGNAITLDMHMTRLFFGTSAPTEPQRRFMIDRIRETASKMGWTPAEVQAALWAWQIERGGGRVNTFSEGLARKKDEIEAFRAELQRMTARDNALVKAAGFDQQFDYALWSAIDALVAKQIEALELGIILAKEVERYHGGASS